MGKIHSFNAQNVLKVTLMSLAVTQNKERGNDLRLQCQGLVLGMFRLATVMRWTKRFLCQ